MRVSLHFWPQIIFVGVCVCVCVCVCIFKGINYIAYNHSSGVDECFCSFLYSKEVAANMSPVYLEFFPTLSHLFP